MPTEQSWDRPLKRIQDIETEGYKDILATGESDAVEKMNEIVQQWTHTQLPELLKSWTRMDFDTKRQCIDSLERFATRLRTETGLTNEQCGAKAISQMIEMLGDMTPDHRNYAHDAARRIVVRG